jgi:hypothetical protein
MVTQEQIESFALGCVLTLSERAPCVLEEIRPLPTNPNLIRISVMMLGTGRRIGYDFPADDIRIWLESKE